MPVYEYYCVHCDGVFDALRQMTAASQPAPCVECGREAERIMPTSIAMFTQRDGYPRRLPDRGTYWHMGKEVKKRISGRFRPFEHPEVTPPQTPKRRPKGEVAAAREKGRLRAREFDKMRRSGIVPSEAQLPKKLREPKRPRGAR